MARKGMVTLVEELRLMTSAGTADYSVAGVTYWDSLHLQDALERRSMRVEREVLYPSNSLDDETFNYRVSQYPCEGTASGTARFVVMDVNETPITGYELNPLTGEIVFSADTSGSVFYARYYAYDLEWAASDVWVKKAGHAAMKVDFSSDGHTVNRSQERKAALAMARYYRSQARVRPKAANNGTF